MFGTVFAHAYSELLKMKGVGAELLIGRVGPRAEKPGHQPANQLIDVCRGLRGRTTSRLEDETICLSVLLGLDVSKVQQIPVLRWKLKDVLMKTRLKSASADPPPTRAIHPLISCLPSRPLTIQLCSLRSIILSCPFCQL